MYPWQQEQWQRLTQSRNTNRLPHALLFAGLAGTGKADFAEYFTRSLLCSDSKANNTPCDACHACRLVLNKAHPNVLRIEPEKAGQAIKVDQIREVSEFVNQTSLQGEYRIVMINPANEMNTNAANALLKTLEEPSSGAILILISDQLSYLPATILSRCQHIHFACPDVSQVKAWLQNKLKDENQNIDLLLRLSNGAPLAALKLAENDVLSLRQNLYQTLIALTQPQSDPVKAVSQLQELETLPFLDFMLTWMMDILRLQLGADTTDITNIDCLPDLKAMTNKTAIHANTKLMNLLQQTRKQINTGFNLNKTMVMESVLIKWSVSCF